MQEEGERYALQSPGEVWALVTFKSGPSPGGATNYVIRCEDSHECLQLQLIPAEVARTPCTSRAILSASGL